MQEKLNEIAAWLENESSKDSDIFGKGVYRYDDRTAISFWGCGAIVCISRLVYFLSEDDGHWFAEVGEHNAVGVQSSFCLSWGNGFAEAMKRLSDYVEKNGKPFYFSGTDIVCGYSLC